MTKSNVPDWVKTLKRGDEIVLVFSWTGTTVFAEITENTMIDPSSIYYGTITVKYEYNKDFRHEDLLLDDYSTEPQSRDSWYAYQLT